jgi:hypothetical protein
VVTGMGPAGGDMRQQVGCFDKNGDERWYYLELDEKGGELMLVTFTD